MQLRVDKLKYNIVLLALGKPESSLSHLKELTRKLNPSA